MKKGILYFLVATIFISSCSNDDEIISPELSGYDLSVINYFKEIALGFESGTATEITRRWTGNMKIFVGGSTTSELLSELDKIIIEINELSTIEFMIETVNDSLQSNFYIYFGSGSSYADIFPSQSNLVASNFGLFNIFLERLK